MDISSQIKEIKQAFRLSMNGVASQRMRECGFNYKINFGVELPRLEDIAAEQPHERALAQALWLESIRESKILACILMPELDFERSLAEVWVDQIPNIEIARLFVMYLLVRLPYAVDLAFAWMASDSDWRQTCGFLLVARLLMRGMELEERSMNELHDQIDAALSSTNAYVAQSARVVLQRIS